MTHDRWFLNRVTTAILSFDGDGSVIPYAGNYDSYRLQRDRREDQNERAIPTAVKRTRGGEASQAGDLCGGDRARWAFGSRDGCGGVGDVRGPS